MLRMEAHILLEAYKTNTWLLYDDESLDAILIDPAAPSPALKSRIQDASLKLRYIINTHGHGDHIAGNDYFRAEFSCPLAIHRLDAAMLTDNKKNLSLYMDFPLGNSAADILLDDAQELDFSSTKIRVIHCPGHTRGSIALLIDGHLISGDTLFEASIGRTDLPGGSHSDIITSIKHKLFTLDDNVVVYPGHGPRTSIGIEKKTNPFVN